MLRIFATHICYAFTDTRRDEIPDKMATKRPAKFTSPGLNSFSNRRRATKSLGPTGTLAFFLSRYQPDPKFIPGLVRRPRAVYLSPFCIGQFPLFRGISKPILGLARAATDGLTLTHPHRRASPHSLASPLGPSRPPALGGPQ